MSKFYLHRSGGSSGIALSGENFVEAVENGFKTIAKETNIGNVAGYSLCSVCATYNDSILGGKGGAVLTICAQGSDALVSYDEENDPVKTYTAWIGGVTREDLPETYFFEIKSEKPFDPFDDIYMIDDNFRLGVIVAFIDELALNHTENKNTTYSLSGDYSSRFTRALENNPVKFANTLMVELDKMKVKSHSIATKMQKRINELFAQLNEGIKFEGIYFLGYYKTLAYFNRFEQLNLLTTLREKTGKTQQQIANETGISLRQYQRIESGTVRLEKTAYATVIALAKAFNVVHEELIKNESISTDEQE